jgi:hypothetical protein
MLITILVIVGVIVIMVLSCVIISKDDHYE